MPGYCIGAFIILTITGMYLLVRSVRPPRRGDTPHCRYCNYNLTELSSQQCPECGRTILSQFIIYGERHPQPSRILLGCLCLSPAIVVIAILFSSLDWYSWMPTSWVMTDCRAARGSIAARAWAELDRRMLAGMLTDSQKNDLPNLLGPLTLNIRPVVIQGYPVPYNLRFEGKDLPGYSKVASMSLNVGKNDKFLDGEALPSQNEGSSGGGLHAGGRSGDSGKIDCKKPGKHTLRIVSHLKIFTGKTILYQNQIVREAAFEVLPSGSTGDVKLIRNPSLVPQLQKDIQPRDFQIKSVSYRPDGQQNVILSAHIMINAPELNMAFRVMALIDGKEYPVGRIACRAGQGGDYGTGGWYNGPIVDKMDIILRSSEDAARYTVDLLEIWDGELVFKDVPVKALVSTTAAP